MDRINQLIDEAILEAQLEAAGREPLVAVFCPQHRPTLNGWTSERACNCALHPAVTLLAS